MSGSKLVVAWLAATLLAGVAGIILLDVPKYYRLTRYGVPAEGSITDLQPRNHRSVIYQYQTERSAYNGGGHAGDIEADFDQLRLGQKVTVFYDPDKQEVSCLGDPSRHLRSNLTGVALITTCPTLYLLVVKIRGTWK